MRSLKLVGAATALFLAHSAIAAAAPIESLKARIAPGKDKPLSCLAGENYDKMVKLDLSISWPKGQMQPMSDSGQSLVIWTSPPDAVQYLFPKGSYAHSGSNYAVSGFFTVRSGGTHQGITAIAFEPVTDTAAAAKEPTVDVTRTRCR